MLKLISISKLPMPMFDGDPGGGGDPGGAADPDPTKTFSADYVKALRGEAAGHRKELQTERQTRTALEATVRKFLGAPEGQPIEDYGRALEGHTAAQAKAIADAQVGAKALLLKADIKAQATALGYIDPDAAALADLSKAQVADDGTITGVKEALEALLTAKPYLKGQAAPGAGAAVNPVVGNEPGPDLDKMPMDEYAARWRKEHGLPG